MKKGVGGSTAEGGAERIGKRERKEEKVKKKKEEEGNPEKKNQNQNPINSKNSLNHRRYSR